MKIALAVMLLPLALAAMVCARIGNAPVTTPVPVTIEVFDLPTQTPTVASAPVLKTCLVATGLDNGALTMRNGPGVGYSPVTWILERQAVELLRSGRGWSQVKYLDLLGWVNSGYLECDR